MHTQFPFAFTLAARFNRPLVVFDLEHTGGTKENRAITEIAAQIIHPDGRYEQYATLVKPPAGTDFLPLVCRLTGIWPSTVKHAPPWAKVITDFVLPYRNAIWVGFNSRVCDTPVILAECRRNGVELEQMAQLDLIRVRKNGGKLSAQVAELVPDFDTSGAHRAAKDALMTLALLQGLGAEQVTDAFLADQGLLSRAKKLKSSKPAAPRETALSAAEGDLSFLVAPGVVRRGQSWLPGEMRWVAEGFHAHADKETALTELGQAIGRSAYAIACALDKAQLLPEELRRKYRLAAA